jgi:purine-binding chemotaxis protein CheW
MSNLQTAHHATTHTALVTTESATQGMFVTMSVAGQMFGIPVLQVQDVLGPQRIAHVPLAPVEAPAV